MKSAIEASRDILAAEQSGALRPYPDHARHQWNRDALQAGADRLEGVVDRALRNARPAPEGEFNPLAHEGMK